MGDAIGVEQVGGLASGPSNPWSTAWLDAVVQASQPMLGDPRRDLAAAPRRPGSSGAARPARRTAPPRGRSRRRRSRSAAAARRTSGRSRSAGRAGASAAALIQTVSCQSRSPPMTMVAGAGASDRRGFGSALGRARLRLPEAPSAWSTIAGPCGACRPASGDGAGRGSASAVPVRSRAAARAARFECPHRQKTLRGTELVARRAWKNPPMSQPRQLRAGPDARDAAIAAMSTEEPSSTCSWSAVGWSAPAPRSTP